MLFFGSQVIAVILAVFLHQGNGRGESPNKGSDSVISPMRANPVWSRTQEVSFWRAWMLHWQSFLDISLIACPEYTPVARSTASSISMLNNNNKRKCVPSNYVVYPNATILFQRNAHALREPIHNDFIEHCLRNTGIFKLSTGKYY